MNTITFPTAYRLLTFLLLVLGVVGVSQWILSAAEFALQPDLLSLALTLDITVLLPCVYFLLIRTSRISIISVIPVFVLSTFLAAYLLPNNHQQYLHWVEWIIAPVELLFVGFLIFQTRQVILAQRKSDTAKVDFIVSLREIIFQKTKNAVFSNVFATEISMFYYAFAGWGSQKEIKGEKAFTYHTSSGYLSIAAVLLVMVIVETIALHIALSLWSVTAAWVMTALSIYSFFFLLGDINAIRKRPIYLDDTYLYFRLGFRWHAQLPLDQIERIELRTEVPEEKTNANLVLFGGPEVCIWFTETQEAKGVYGIRKKFNSLSFPIDKKEEFKEILEQSKDKTPS